MSQIFEYKLINTPVGVLKLIADDAHLLAVLWENDNPRRVPFAIDARRNNSHPVLIEAEKQFNDYFEQKRNAFALPLRFIGSDFQKSVWEALNRIPYGETRSYGQIATEINHPKAVRAVGAANGRNPLSIVIPCHRVIGSNGKLTGFAGGLEVKTYLLELESKLEQLSAAQMHLQIPALSR